MTNFKTFTQTASVNLSDEILGIRLEELTRNIATYVAYLITAVVYVIEQGRNSRQIIDNLVTTYETQWVKAPSFTTEPVTLNQSIK